MAGLLDALINQYGNGASNPYATPQAAPAQSSGASINIPVAAIGSLIDSLGKGASNPYAGMNQTSGMSPNPQIIPISQQEADAAVRQQAASNVGSYSQPSAAATAARQGVGQPSPVAAPTPAPTSAPAIQSASVPDTSVAQVNTGTDFPSASDYNADGTQAAPGSSADSGQAGGLLGSLAGAASDAVSDPVKSKGLLSALGGAVSDIGTKLQTMSPAASQGLIAAGMSMLANNDGRHNLAQLIGDGGVNGINAYQQVNMNRIAAAKNLIDMQHMQNQDQVAAQNAATEQWKAQHPSLSPDQAIVDATGTGGAPVTSGVQKAYGTVKQIQPDGSTVEYPTGINGQPLPGAQGVKTADPNVGPLPPEQLKVVNDANTQSAKDQHALLQTQTMLEKLQSVNIPAGLKAKGQDLWTQVTGNQNEGQILRNMLQQQTYQDYLATWKPGIGGRLTNTDVNLLKQGMPPDTASSQTWTKFLTSYGKLQSDVADQSARAAAFASQNRGQLDTLRAPLTVGGVTYGSGTPYSSVVMGQGGTGAQQSGQNGGAANAALLAEAQRRGLKQNANGQWVIPQ